MAGVELRHHFLGEERQARADVFVGVLASLVEQNHLVDVGAFEFAQAFADGVGRADQLAAGALLAGRRLLPLLIALPEVHRAGGERAFLVVELQGELEERPAVGLLPRFLVGFGAHEAGDDGDVRIGLVVGELLQIVDVGVVVGVYPGTGGVEAHELEAQRTHAPVRRVLDGVQLRAGHPQRRMRLLQRLRHHGAQRKLEELAVVLPAVVPEHRQRAAHRVFPDVALVAVAQVEGVQFGHRRAFAQAKLHAPVGDEIQRGDALGHPRRMVGGELHDAVPQADVARALACRRQEDLGGGGVGVLLQEVVLHFPCVVEPQAVRQFDLRQRLLQQPVLAVRLPVPRQLMLVEDAEFHARAPASTTRWWQAIPQTANRSAPCGEGAREKTAISHKTASRSP